MKRLSSKQFINNNKSLVTKCIMEYLDSSVYDYSYFAKTRDYITVKNIPQLLEFAYNNLPLETYRKFHNKAAPFEPSLEKDDVAEKEKLKSEMAIFVLAVRNNNANLIDIIDLGIRDMKQYAYIAKLLVYDYRLLSTSIYLNNLEYVAAVEKYNSDTSTGEVYFSDMTPELEKAMLEVLKSRNLKINSITLSAAHAYCKRKLNSNKTR